MKKLIGIADGWGSGCTMRRKAFLLGFAGLAGILVLMLGCERDPSNPMPTSSDTNAVENASPTNDVDEQSGGLVLYYSFDADEGGTVTDASGAGHDGSVHGAVWTAQGKRGGAYTFDGIDDYIKADGYKGVLGAHAMSVCAWARSDVYVPSGTVIVRWGDGTGGLWGGMFELIYNGSEDHSIVGLVGGWMVKGGYAPQGDGVWHHAVLTTDGSVVSLYIDGQLASSVDTSQGINIKSMIDVSIGQAEDSSYLQGAIDEVRIYDRALSADEVASLAD